MERELQRWILDATMWTVGVFTGLALVAHEAMAGGARMPAPTPTYSKECGACHVPYPAALLPAGAWKRVMEGLDAHFGTDASLDGPQARRVADALARGAGTGKRVAGAESSLRITETPWFRREHRKVPGDTWRSKEVANGARCEACHGGAALGDYNEDAVRMPAGGAR